MSNRRDIQFTYNPHNKATILDCSFTVASTDSAGLGLTGLNPSGRVSSVYMHTSATPAAGSPNPASGVIVVNLSDTYNRYLSGYSQHIVALSGSSISISGSTVMTIGAPYVITALGTSTQANWVAMGLPANISAAVGVSFIASATGSGTGTGTVQAPAAAGSGIGHIEVIGNPNLMNSNGAYTLGGGQGMQIILGCYKVSSTLTMNSYTPAGTNDSATPPIFTGTPAVLTGTVASANVLAAPANGSLVMLNFYMNNSAQGV